jgi:hypothetical protein
LCKNRLLRSCRLGFQGPTRDILLLLCKGLNAVWRDSSSLLLVLLRLLLLLLLHLRA